MAMTEEEYRADQEARAKLTEQTLKVTDQSQPIPTQEENDLMRLGLMHPDAKAQPDNPEMPSLRLQQALLGHAQETAAVPDRPTPEPGPPQNIDVPMISGEGTVGQTLSCTMGNWHGDPTSYAYQWRSGEGVVGSGGDSYVIGPDDVGNDITCVVTATNIGGSTTAPPSNAITVNPLGGTRRSRS